MNNERGNCANLDHCMLSTSNISMTSIIKTIDPMTIRALKESDINGLNRLPPKDWNYNFEDFLTGFMKEDFFYAFVLIKDENIVGIGNVFIKGKVGWLANIIVDTNYRSQGLGFKMTKYLVGFLKEKECETQLLIATELGEAVYQKVGFRKTTDYLCFDSEVDVDYTYSKSIRELKDSDLERVYQLDREVNDENRIHLIDRYYDTGLGYFNNDGELLGFYLPLFGRGLVLSRDPKAGIELLKFKHSKKGKRTLLPIENQDGVNFLKNFGLSKGHKLSRMILGKENKWKPKYMYSYGAGFCG